MYAVETVTTTTTLSAELEEHVTALWAQLARAVPAELSRTSASVLHAVASEPRRVTELAAMQAVAQPTMTVLVGRLQARRLVTRQHDPADRRATLVAATDAGRGALARRSDARTSALAGGLDALDAADHAALHAALGALQRLSGALA